MAPKLLILALIAVAVVGVVSADSSLAPTPSSGTDAETGEYIPLPEAGSDDAIGNTYEPATGPAAAGPATFDAVEAPIGGPVASVEQAFGPVASGPSSGVAAIEASALAGAAGAAAVAGFFFFF